MNYSGTIFCDIDGTLVIHDSCPDYTKPLVLIDGALEKLNVWIDDGYYICLTTARTEEKELIQALENVKINYHKLITGLPSSPRFLINDKKPNNLLISQAKAFEVDRNVGISHINITSDNKNILKKFRGGSFADTFLVEENSKLYVRKRVLKTKNLKLGYEKLKKQFDTLKRFNKLKVGLVPVLLKEEDNFYEYYYDMEYFDGYKSLSEIENKYGGLEILHTILKKCVYIQSMERKENWIENHFENKIFPILSDLESNAKFKTLIYEKNIIDNKNYNGLKTLLNEVLNNNKIFEPKKFFIVHGDLTFENILIKDNNIKLIDMCGANLFDAAELDLGKLFQSTFSGYDTWGSMRTPLIKKFENNIIETEIFNLNNDNIQKLLLENWSEILNCSEHMVLKTGLFYMTLHLIRMIPYRLEISEDQGLYATTKAIKALDLALSI